MTSSFKRLSAWAYGLESGRRWRLWAVLAVVAAVLVTALPSPWSWVTTLPIAVFGVVLFNGQARRERDEQQRRD